MDELNEGGTYKVEDPVSTTGGLAKWDNPPKVSDLKQDLQEAKSDHDTNIGLIDEWLDALNIEGAVKKDFGKGRSSVQPKLIRKQAEWLYSAMSEPFLSTDDLFNTEPVTYEDKKAAIQNGLILNNQFNTKIKKVDFIDEYVRTAVDEGTVITKVSWEYEDEEVEVDIPDFSFTPSNDPAVLQVHEQLQQMMQSSPEQFEQEVPEELKQAHQMTVEQGIPILVQQTGSHKEMQTNIIKNHPALDVCANANVTIDPTCLGDLDKARFVIYSFDTDLSELERDGKYSNVDQIEIGGNSPFNEPDHVTAEDDTFTFADDPRKKMVAYEYWGFWDINDEGIVKPIVATWVGSTLIRLEENPFPDGKVPFVVANFLPVRKSIYGEPNAVLIEDNQKIIGAVTRGMIDIMGRSANGQIGTSKDFLDISNKRKMDKGMDYEFTPGKDPRTNVHMHTFPEIPQSAQYMLNLQNGEAESLTGVVPFSGSNSTQSFGQTATGVRSALDAVSKRELGILRRLAEGVKQIGRKIIAMNGEFLSEEEVVRITNEEFVTIKRDDLAGNIDLKLSISTAEADEQKAQELAFTIQTSAPSDDPEVLKMIRAEQFRLRKMPDLAKKIETFVPHPDPLQQEKARLEIELLKAQIAKEQSMAQENQANAALDMAKAETEKAKVRNLGSDSDLKDLNFLEQEGGTAHQRDVDKIDMQNANAQEGKVIDAAIREREHTQKNTTTTNGLGSI